MLLGTLSPSFLSLTLAGDSLDGIRGEIWLSVRLEFVGSSSSAAASEVRMFTASRLPRSLYPFQFILGLVEELVVRWRGLLGWCVRGWVCGWGDSMRPPFVIRSCTYFAPPVLACLMVGFRPESPGGCLPFSLLVPLPCPGG